MKKTIYIHIGTQKAGSTSIQTFLSKNHSALLKSGIFYPLIGRKPPFENKEEKTFINGDFIQKKDYELILEEIILEFKKNNCPYMCLSEEGLSSASPISEYNLDIYYKLQKFNPKIIVYLRRSAEYLTSFWQECVRNGILVPNLDEFAMEHQYLESLNKINEISKIIGKENIIVRTFEKERWLNNNLIDDFLTIFNVENSNKFQQLNDTINQGMSRNETEKRMFLNRHLLGVDQKNHEYNLYQATTKDANAQKIIDSLSDEKIREISDKYHPYECEIAKKFLGREELFLSRYPKIYGVKRNYYTDLDRDTKEELRFLVNIAIQKNMIDIQSRILALQENKKIETNPLTTPLIIKKFRTKRFFVMLLCALIPRKNYRRKIRNHFKISF